VSLFKRETKPDETQIWQKYQKGVDYHNKNNLYSDTETFYNMVEADQWNGIESGDEKLSSRDFISGIVNHKVAMVAMNLMTINYSSLNHGENQEAFRDACDKLNQFAASKWELTKMDIKDWDMVNAACVSGDSYLFFYNSNLDSQIIDRTNIYLSDEQEPDMQKQKHVIIYERRFVSDVKDDAKKNGIKQEEIEKIVSDEDTENLPKIAQEEVKSGEKCSCLLYIEKKADGIYISRSTQTVIYQKETKIDGLKKIPIASMIWFKKRGSARGVGEVKRWLNNQINANKLCVRRELNNKMTGYPKPVYDATAVQNPTDVDKVGTSIKLQGQPASKVRDFFDYVAPQAMSGDGLELQNELINGTRDLANAGDSATGAINPEKASGTAIIAVKDQQAIATSKQEAYHKQFIEDVAAIWLDMWIAYNPNGLEVPTEEHLEDGTTVSNIQVIPAEILQQLEINIRIDVSPTNPYSKFAREQAIENALAQNHITFEEYVEALDDDANAPKGKFKDILDKRKVLQQQQEQSELAQANDIIAKQQQLLGGMPNDMQQMPIMQG
jgi:hypothetical protein